MGHRQGRALLSQDESGYSAVSVHSTRQTDQFYLRAAKRPLADNCMAKCRRVRGLAQRNHQFMVAALNQPDRGSLPQH